MMRARQQFKGVVRPLIEQDTAHQFQALSRSCLGITHYDEALSGPPLVRTVVWRVLRMNNVFSKDT